MTWILIVIMAGPSWSSKLTMQEFSDKLACATAREWVDRNSGNVRQSTCLPKSSEIGSDVR